MDENTQKEEFSYGYLSLLCTVNELTFQRYDRALDNRGLDGSIIKVGNLNGIPEVGIDVQVKCTSREVEKEEGVKFPLTVKDYDKLRDKNVYRSRILIVVLVPQNVEEWLTTKEDEMTARRCGYWINLKGEEKVKQQSKTITIPKSNKISLKTLLNILEEEAENYRNLMDEIENSE